MEKKYIEKRAQGRSTKRRESQAVNRDDDDDDDDDDDGYDKLDPIYLSPKPIPPKFPLGRNDKETEADVGICLHVAKQRVSLELCAFCNSNAAGQLKGLPTQFAKRGWNMRPAVQVAELNHSSSKKSGNVRTPKMFAALHRLAYKSRKSTLAAKPTPLLAVEQSTRLSAKSLTMMSLQYLRDYQSTLEQERGLNQWKGPERICVHENAKNHRGNHHSGNKMKRNLAEKEE
uniref:Uncharacterized protein n=1 Tax=Timema bartmani TaxID=61472 RepID=A0A7R9HYI0_9NEOP|nr:unnamed protein product [Timema bartmani]